MQEDIRNTLTFAVKDFRDEDFKAYEAIVPSASLDLTYEEVKFIEPLSCGVSLFRQEDDNIYVTADITTTLSVECRRCINPFEMHITATLELLFSIGNEASEHEADGERYYDGETLDISEDVRQALVLEIPAWPLCSETCKGLCPECGTELNTADCSCEITDETAVSAANPFSVLSKMLDNS